ncbi:DUF1365 domain-containing protein [Pandoraea apista]|uniref:DUF1365 domain-containing protein n=1 Tax=Pandoraea apista TaxID=93218 RepID=A0ABX9ZJY9_9BURK|nr:DUF1365 domain-containing protein [Pandoraea apista]AVF40851.1 DUF1365 domain-containing protein [Pandoraea apista]PTE00558.1 DUF1365 domain-containing protein [Pandoraea apista]RRJ27472.1 DUF1365 domain-containing protein [Pandoraea apista]RRJ79581.1 DUF1365 domain-containing protein [Pandoraea apista]RSC99799.1 DUF1365 domain-containing protein [Pandoraea apista]
MSRTDMPASPPASEPAAIWLLRGRVTHERLHPVRHAFAYPMFQIACNVGRAERLHGRWFAMDRTRALCVQSRDYGPRDGSALSAWMRERLAEAGIPANGEIWLQTIPRMAGFAFNPVSFWYCHDREGNLRALYADVRNTFGQHHGYLLSAPGHVAIHGNTRLVCRKVFHVSPFCDVEGQYEFRVRREGAAWSVAIDYRVGDTLVLRTAIAMRAEPFTGARVFRAVLSQPFNALNVVIRIHWQALRLWVKRVPFYGKTPPTLSAASPHHPTSSDREIHP